MEVKVASKSALAKVSTDLKALETDAVALLLDVMQRVGVLESSGVGPSSLSVQGGVMDSSARL